jgi:hypothetical protein
MTIQPSLKFNNQLGIPHLVFVEMPTVLLAGLTTIA